MGEKENPLIPPRERARKRERERTPDEELTIFGHVHEHEHEHVHVTSSTIRPLMGFASPPWRRTGHGDSDTWPYPSRSQKFHS